MSEEERRKSYEEAKRLVDAFKFPTVPTSKAKRHKGRKRGGK